MWRLPRTGLIAAVLLAALADAHEGEPPRQLDKTAQHRAGLRTLVVERGQPSASLPARVVADPRALLRIAAAQAGTVTPASEARPGRAVAAGELLGWFEPALSTPSRNEVGGALALARRDAAIGRVQVERFQIDEAQQFEQKLPTPTLQILTEYRGATGRAGALTLAGREPVRAPRAGRLLRAPASAGRLLQVGDPLFEIDAAAAPALAAEYVDDDLDAAAAREAVTADGRRVALAFLGEGYDPRARVHRALYAPAADAALPAINESLRLEMPRGAAAIRIPTAALFTDDGETRVWVHDGAERFESREVVAERDQASGFARIDEGLAPGERVVVSGLPALAAAAAAR